MFDDLSIRLAKDTDTETLVDFNVAIALDTERKELSPAVVTKGVQTLLNSPEYGFYIVAESADQIVGSVMVTFEWSDWRCGLIWWLQSIYVRREFRQKGVFSRLYAFLKAKASDEGNVCGFRLYVEQDNSIAKSTYSSVGLKKLLTGSARNCSSSLAQPRNPLR
ncbi:MAG: GNAT family N-acetyltransferase [Planctomycetota bacterium]|jgi:GNAT superfamily N-acetyltransferase